MLKPSVYLKCSFLASISGPSLPLLLPPSNVLGRTEHHPHKLLVYSYGPLPWAWDFLFPFVPQDLSKDALAPTLESSVGDGKECLDPSYDLLS